MATALASSGSILKGLRTAKGPKFGSIAFSTPSLFFVGMGAAKGISKGLTEGTLVTNPLFYSNTHSGYGKRGIDADKMGAGGLVQGLHNKRRNR